MATDQSAFIVNRMPILAMLPKFLPGMTFKKQAAAWRAQFTELAERGYTVALKRIKSGTYKPCMISKALTEHAGEFDPELIKYTATQVYTGGADTSLSVLSSFFLAMTLYPRVQEKAQLEVDQLLGVNRPPSFSDCEKLPYTRSLMREVFRCFPPIPLSEVAGRDDIHEGYHVSKGTILFINIWAILHDKSVYGDPDDFRPERWLSENLIDRESDSMDIAFGFGRRACPGQRLAEKLVLTVIASTLSAFTITPTIDHDGKPIIPSAEYTDGTITFPRTFACEIRPRKPL
ncbi:cytochrome P450 [Wolfiporia cocos MD-104 SS10]|uniref:Cytochrome P450 n=1 Tax=Wolfiporia cocos (strain MD-104) TaxID=742152 RepID=A0A2H3J492_WOLCO|nr:cytochrome P450 [Wolfiporia cocos MD-104 SS10]